MKKVLLALILVIFSTNVFTKTETKQLKKLEVLIKEKNRQKFDSASINKIAENPELLKKMSRLDEEQFTAVEKEVLSKLKFALLNKSTDQVVKYIEKTGDFLNFSNISKSILSTKGGIEELPWSNFSLVNNRKSFLDSLTSYVSEFNQIVDVQLLPLKVKSFVQDRNQTDLSMKAMEVQAYLDIRGFDKNNYRRNDRGYLTISLINYGKAWTVNKFVVSEAETLKAVETKFNDMTVTSGLKDFPKYLRREAIRRGGYSISVNDYNNDKKVDLIVGTSGELEIFKGDGQGKFVKDLNTNIKNETLVKTSLLADFRNTGKQDLLLVRFDPRKTQDSMDVVLYENNGEGQFKNLNSVNRKNNSNYAMPATIADFNNDGLIDIYVGFPGEKDFTFHSNKIEHGKDKLVQGLFFANSKNGFDEVSTESLGSEDPFTQKLYPHSAISSDFDKDGDMDIVVVDDRGNLSPVYLNLGNGKFNQTAEAIGLGNYDYGMGAAVGDLNNDGELDFALTNVNFLAAKRIHDNANLNWNFDYPLRGQQGLRLFERKNGKYIETTALLKGQTGDGLAGVEFFDYNNDGLLDIYVANGLWSSNDKGQNDLSSLFVRSWDKLPVDFDTSAIRGTETLGPVQTQSAMMNALSETILIQGIRPSMAGNQRNRLYRNDGGGKFTEVGFLEGVDSLADGYVIATADINLDGNLDLILRNGDPGSVDTNFSPIEVFVNKGNKEKSVILTLEGTKANRDAIGAIVEAELVDGQKITRHLIANNGTAQSEKIVHIGMGNNKLIEKLTVIWPGGKNIDTFKDLSPGRYLIQEGSSKVLTALK